MNRFVVISGCSGGGKSTLLAELARRGHAVVEEPGRRIVAEEMRTGGSALPWVDAAAFARRAVAMALADRASVPDTGSWVFFDRGLIDAAAGLQQRHRRAGAPAPRGGPPLPRPRLPDATLAGDLHDRRRAPPRSGRRRGRIRAPAPRLSRPRLRDRCSAQGRRLPNGPTTSSEGSPRPSRGDAAHWA